MAITYPLSTPTSIGIESIELRAVNAVATSQSPFTFKQQIVSHQGQMWQAAVSIPSVRRDLAEDWNAFLLSLRGPIGTFLLGDPNSATPRGSALSFKKNLLTFTEQFDQWSIARADVTVNATVAPDGNTTADALDANDPLSSYVFQQVTLTAGVSYAFSVHVKANTHTGDVTLRDFTDLSGVEVNLTTLSVSNIGTATNGGVEDVGNGWYRISCTLLPTSPTRPHNLGIIVESEDLGVYIWGAQLEEGSLSEYQPIANAYGPFVNGASQTGSELNIDGASPDEDAYLKAGDYIQLGSGSSSTLHKVLADVSTNSAGEATIDIWPSIRTAPADNATVTIENCKGVFRLAQNVSSWSINNASTYGISFEAVEVIK